MPNKISHLIKKIFVHTFIKLRVKPLVFLADIRQFLHNYRLPVLISILLSIPVLYLALVRFSESKSLLNLLPNTATSDQNYGSLLLGDRADEFNRGDTTEAQTTPTTTANNTNTFSITTPNGSSNSTQSNGSSGSSNGSTDGTSNGGNVTPPFSAAISSFTQNGSALVCGNALNQTRGNCSKIYRFNANVQTVNGPGSVAYRWVSNQADINSPGTYSAPNGTSSQTLQKEVTLACNKSSSFTLQFALTAPTTTQSNTLTVSHNCNELLL